MWLVLVFSYGLFGKEEHQVKFYSKELFKHWDCFYPWTRGGISVGGGGRGGVQENQQFPKLCCL